MLFFTKEDNPCKDLDKIMEILKKGKKISETINLLDKYVPDLKKNLKNIKNDDIKTLAMFQFIDNWVTKLNSRCKEHSNKIKEEQERKMAKRFIKSILN